MPNLENLKKQAKLYLRWHRDGYYPVAAQIRAVLPRFRHLTDQAVLAHNFKSALFRHFAQVKQLGFKVLVSRAYTAINRCFLHFSSFLLDNK